MAAALFAFGPLCLHAEAQEDSQGIPRATRAAGAQSYQLSPKDVIRVTVYQEDDLATIARIGKDGTLQFPLVGAVSVAGQTVMQASRTFENRLREYLVRPQVSITVIEYSKRRFTILGEVSDPGTYDMPDDTSVNLLEAIGMAGGYTRIAKPSKVILKRNVGGQEKIFELDAKKMAKDPQTTRFSIEPGDTIIVSESIF